VELNAFLPAMKKIYYIVDVTGTAIVLSKVLCLENVEGSMHLKEWEPAGRQGAEPPSGGAF
jgi:hypothetical protein